MKIAYQTIHFRQESLDLIDICNRIIDEYTQAGFVLTRRQLYYQLVARGIIPNADKQYDRLISIVNNGRLAGLIDWEAIEDRTRNVRSIAHFDGPKDGLDSLAYQYAIDKWADQPVRPEVWIEKDALVGVVEQVCKELDVACFSCRGYCSQSEMWGASQRFLSRALKSQKTHVIHLGDHDPSGIDMSRDIEERIRMFLQRYAMMFSIYECFPLHHFGFTRIALNRDQIDLYQPPANPAKPKDVRFEAYKAVYGDSSWEVDALPPQVLVALIRNKVVEIRNENLYLDRVTQEASEKRQLELIRDNWKDIAASLNE